MELPSIARIAVSELQIRLQQARPPLLVDVRELDEWEYCRLPGAQHLPLSELESRYAELDRSQEIVLYCHHGMRSMQAAEFLAGAGFARLASLDGGIDAWAAEIDPNVPRY